MALLEKYNFPTELSVQIANKTIEFTIPVSLTKEDKARFFEQDFYKEENNMIIIPKPRTSKTYIIKGGTTGIQGKIKALVYLLNHVLKDGKPIFQCEYIPESKYPLPTNRFRFLNKDIPPTVSEDEIDNKYAQSINLENLKKYSQKDSYNRATYTQAKLELSTEEVYLLVSIFSQDQAQNISSLIQDENHDSQVFHLNIPVSIGVAIKYVGFDKYEMSFADGGQIKGEVISNQIKNVILPNIKSTECVIATFSRTDPIFENRSFENQQFIKCIDKNAVAVFVPDETTTEEDFETTYVEVFVPKIDDILANLEQKFNEYYDGVKLSVCKKCKLFFCPKNTEEKCYTYYHTGQQIAFPNSGQMEEIEFDEGDEEPVTYVYYTCCGEFPKDELPMECGKKENGNHEIDTSEGKEGIISELIVKKGHPGEIHFTE